MIRFFLLLIGFIFNFAAYGNLYSFIVYIVIYYFSKLTKGIFLKKQNNNDKDIALWIFILIYFFSGLLEILFINLGPFAMPSDVYSFYVNASDLNWNLANFDSQIISGLEIDNFRGLKEDFLPIFIWNQIYKLFNFIGIPAGRYIGTAINTLFIVWTSYLGFGIIRSTEYLNNKGTENFYKFLFCANPLFWLYGSIHLRESIILFFVSLLLRVWINWINKKSFFNFIFLGIISIIYFLLGEYLRGGYSYLLYAVISSYLLSNIFENIITRKVSLIQFFSYSLFFIALIVSTQNIDTSFGLLTLKFNSYNAGSALLSTEGSLGMAVINQPIPIRSIASIIYLLMMPIPIWSGQTIVFSLFNFFKSCFGLFNYFTLPILFIVIKETIVNYKNVNQIKLFLIFLFFQTLIIIGLTSLDQRHLGNFSLIYILLLCFINRNSKTYINEYKSLIKYLFISLYFLYFFYMIYKFQSIFVLLIFFIVPLIILILFGIKKYKLNKYINKYVNKYVNK